GIGELRHLAEPFGHGLDRLARERQPVDECVVVAFRTRALHVLGIRGEDGLLALDERLGRRLERAILLRGGRTRERAARLAGARAHGLHHGLERCGVEVHQAACSMTGRPAIPSASSSIASHGSPASTPLIMRSIRWARKSSRSKLAREWAFAVRSIAWLRSGGR